MRGYVMLLGQGCTEHENTPCECECEWAVEFEGHIDKFDHCQDSHVVITWVEAVGAAKLEGNVGDMTDIVRESELDELRTAIMESYIEARHDAAEYCLGGW